MTPPRIAEKLLEKLLRDDLLEEVRGDLLEKFYLTLKNKSPLRAKLDYFYQVIHYLRPFAIRKTRSFVINTHPMIQNYLTVAWRNLTRQRMYSAIKVGGFALGIAACLLITLFILDELNFDKDYPNSQRIYRVVETYKADDGGRAVWFQAPFANALREDYAEVEMAGRYNSSELFGAGGNEIRPGDAAENTYEEGFVYFDQELLDILQLPVIYGNPKHALDEPHTIVITKRKADKYFPGQNPVGKTMIANNDTKNPFKIGAVIADFPETSHLQFDFLMTMKGVEFWKGEQNYWGATNYPTYVLLKPGVDPVRFEAKLNKIVEKYMLPSWIADEVANPKDLVKRVSFQLQPVSDIHLLSAGIKDSVSHGDIRFVWMFGAIAVFILIIACINFINLSTAKSANRAKEVGLRKSIGSDRSHIVNQFLTESCLFSFLSFGLGIVAAWLMLPYFNQLATKSLTFPWDQWKFYPIVLASALLIGIIAGIYPSFYLSAFKPVNVLKGNLSRGSKSSATRSTLVVFQFTTSIVLIIATFIIYRQVEFILNTNLGFDKDQVLMIQGAGPLGKKVETFKDELRKLSSVKNATISDYLPIRGTKRNGNGFWNAGKSNEEKSVGSQIWRVDEDYLQTLGIKLVAGRNFSTHVKADSDAIIINQSMMKSLHIKDPIGVQIETNRVWTIIGVVEDFNFETLRERIGPLALVRQDLAGTVSVKINPGDIANTVRAIDRVWRKFGPNQPLRYAFMDDTYARMYTDVKRMGSIFTTFAILAIIVACLGLFALSAFMVEQRGKEISIRLVLGASLQSIFSILTVNFLKLVLTSILIASPIAWYLMTQWLMDYQFKTEITWDVFVLAGSIGIIIALSTISYQSIKAAFVNPVQNLKEQ